MNARAHTHVDRVDSSGVELTALDGYTPGMKTAISIPDDVFQEADRLAAEQGKSRSELYSRAIREYVARHSSERITAALNAVYAEPEDEAELEFVDMVARETLRRSEW
jgi:metal-responsive CopG/Arc/MetJ family transcriptional regulator